MSNLNQVSRCLRRESKKLTPRCKSVLPPEPTRFLCSFETSATTTGLLNPEDHNLKQRLGCDWLFILTVNTFRNISLLGKCPIIIRPCIYPTVKKGVFSNWIIYRSVSRCEHSVDLIFLIYSLRYCPHVTAHMNQLLQTQILFAFQAMTLRDKLI
jgi:hypothetical protein